SDLMAAFVLSWFGSDGWSYAFFLAVFIAVPVMVFWAKYSTKDKIVTLYRDFDAKGLICPDSIENLRGHAKGLLKRTVMTPAITDGSDDYADADRIYGSEYGVAPISVQRRGSLPCRVCRAKCGVRSDGHLRPDHLAESVRPNRAKAHHHYLRNLDGGERRRPVLRDDKPVGRDCSARLRVSRQRSLADLLCCGLGLGSRRRYLDGERRHYDGVVSRGRNCAGSHRSARHTRRRLGSIYRLCLLFSDHGGMCFVGCSRPVVR